MDVARNNFSTLVYGNGGGRGPATCVYAIIGSLPAGLVMRWMHTRNALRVAEISK